MLTLADALLNSSCSELETIGGGEFVTLGDVAPGIHRIAYCHLVDRPLGRGIRVEGESELDRTVVGNTLLSVAHIEDSSCCILERFANIK